jgi:hypothetical protein
MGLKKLGTSGGKEARLSKKTDAYRKKGKQNLR